MKRLGRGWQYTTYDLGNGRVLKKYNHPFIAYLIMLRDCFPYIRNPLWKLPAYYRGCKLTARDSMEKIQHPVLELWMMGNPRVLNGLDYEQDKVTPLLKYFRTINAERGKVVIDAFVGFNRMLVDKRLIDKSFNITKNFGIDSLNRIVLIDLGELYSSDAAIRKQLQNRAWASFYVTKDVPRSLRRYFLQKMDAAFST
jgi:hypothetical protein